MTAPTPRTAGVAMADVHFFAAMARSSYRNLVAEGENAIGRVHPRHPAGGHPTTDRRRGAPLPAPGRLGSLSQPASPAAGLCPVTTYPALDNWSPRLYSKHRCGEPVVAGGLCAKHLADRDRLGGAS